MYLTRNQAYGNVPRVRIPPSPPEIGPTACQDTSGNSKKPRQPGLFHVCWSNLAFDTPLCIWGNLLPSTAASLHFPMCTRSGSHLGRRSTPACIRTPSYDPAAGFRWQSSGRERPQGWVGSHSVWRVPNATRCVARVRLASAWDAYRAKRDS